MLHDPNPRPRASRKTMHLALRAGERVFVNGAILRADRKVSIELLNDATFLLEQHVLQPEATTTPLKQLYFVIQTMLMEPAQADAARILLDRMLFDTIRTFEDREILYGLKEADGLIADGRLFDALKKLRSLFGREAQVLADEPASLGPGRQALNSAIGPHQPSSRPAA